MKRILMALLTLSVGTAQASVKEKERKALEVLDDSIENLAKTDVSCTKSSHCTEVGYGDRNCGSNYFALTSVYNRNLKIIKYLANQSNIRGRAFSARYDQEECVDYQNYELKCVNKKCVTVTIEEEN